MKINPTYEAKETQVQIGNAHLGGCLTIVKGSKAIVLFVHGSGSSRFSKRNQFVSKELNKVGLSTLLFDLLTEEEEKVDRYTREYRFNISLLSERLLNTIDWVKFSDDYKAHNIGLFGSSTGAAAALIVAAKRPTEIGAVVSRGGRPDLAGDALSDVQASTLFIVGGYDTLVIQLNEEASKLLVAKHQIKIVPEASHLFEEPGKLEQVAKLASQWFVKYLL